MVFEFDEEFTKLKRNENIIDFSDIEHIALKILADEEISEDYRNQFEYIYIDEYQDSNLVQEEIINRIKKEDNRKESYQTNPKPMLTEYLCYTTHPAHF